MTTARGISLEGIANYELEFRLSNPPFPELKTVISMRLDFKVLAKHLLLWDFNPTVLDPPVPSWRLVRPPAFLNGKFIDRATSQRYRRPERGAPNLKNKSMKKYLRDFFTHLANENDGRVWRRVMVNLPAIHEMMKNLNCFFDKCCESKREKFESISSVINWRLHYEMNLDETVSDDGYVSFTADDAHKLLTGEDVRKCLFSLEELEKEREIEEKISNLTRSSTR